MRVVVENNVASFFPGHGVHLVRICSIENREWQGIHSVEDLCVEDTNVLDSCDRFSGDYKQEKTYLHSKICYLMAQTSGHFH